MGNNPLNMAGMISGGFNSGMNVYFVPEEVEFVDGVAQESPGRKVKINCTVQPMVAREIQALGIGVDRIKDYRKIHVNDSSAKKFYGLKGHFEFDGSNWRPIDIDYRPLRTYCRVTLARNDP